MRSMLALGSPIAAWSFWLGGVFGGTSCCLEGRRPTGWMDKDRVVEGQSVNGGTGDAVRVKSIAFGP